MGKKILAGVIGVLTAVGLVWLIEKIGHAVWPPPADLDFGDMDVMRAYIDTLPLGALLTVAVAWFVGAAGGTFAACRLGSARPLVYALIVGGMIFAGAAFNLTIIPHPAWFSILGLVGVVAGATLGMKLGSGQDSGA